MNRFLRDFFRNTYLSAAGTISRPSSGIFILNSHFALQQTPNSDVFTEFLYFLSKYCDFIRVEDAVEMILNRKVVKECLLSFTFDDGFEECNSIIAPVLEEYNVNGAFFINANFINGDDGYVENFTQNIVKTPNKTPLNWRQVVDMHKKGHIIGSHTLDHVNMNTSDYDYIEFQIKENKEQIERQINFPCDYFAYPFGRLSDINYDTLKISEKYHKVIFSGSNYLKYSSFDGRVLNRRHLECWWPKTHINYFLSANRKY